MIWTRRDFFKGALLTGGASFASAGVGLYSYAIEPCRIKQTDYVLNSKKWPEDMGPLTIAAAGDFHVGCPSVDLTALDGIVDRLNALSADIIFLLGDFLIKGVRGGTYVPPEPIAEKLSRLKAPLGVVAVLGNHDWWRDGRGMWKALEKVGIQVLENSAVPVLRNTKTFWVAGLADDTTRTPDIKKALAGVKDDAPVIMLSHDPAPFVNMVDRPVITLCGHTHGGQVAIPFIGPIIIPGRAPMKYAYGHIEEEGRDMIVTSGLGTSILPVRFNRRPEIMKITLSSPSAISRGALI